MATEAGEQRGAIPHRPLALLRALDASLKCLVAQPKERHSIRAVVPFRGVAHIFNVAECESGSQHHPPYHRKGLSHRMSCQLRIAAL